MIRRPPRSTLFPYTNALPIYHPDDDYIYLLDDGVVRLEADGRGSRTYRQVVQILTREAAETRSEEHTSELQSRLHLVCRLLLEKKKTCTDHYETHTHQRTTAV